MTNTHHYLLTIRKHQVKDYVTPEELTDVIINLKLRISSLHIIQDCYETDSKYQQLHWHAWVTTGEYIHYSKYSSNGNFRIYWRSLRQKSPIQVIQYLHKQATNKYVQSQIIDLNYYNHIYSFIE